jgi:queuosine precursor transporter
MRILEDQNSDIAPHIVWRREVVFMMLSGLFLGSLTMLNILGITRFIDISLFLGAASNTYMLPVGVLAYPVTFLCTDFISEIYGKKRANLLVWIGLGLNIWVLFILWLGGALPPQPEICDAVGFLNGIEVGEAICPQAGLPPMSTDGRIFFQLRYFAFGATIASMIAYLLAQFCDVYIFHYLKKLTKGKHLWLRNNGSTLISQLLDSTAVILSTYFFTEGALPINAEAGIVNQLAAFIITGYVFKVIAALFDTIFFYLGMFYFRKYLGIADGYENIEMN